MDTNRGRNRPLDWSVVCAGAHDLGVITTVFLGAADGMVGANTKPRVLGDETVPAANMFIRSACVAYAI